MTLPAARRVSSSGRETWKRGFGLEQSGAGTGPEGASELLCLFSETTSLSPTFTLTILLLHSGDETEL